MLVRSKSGKRKSIQLWLGLALVAIGGWIFYQGSTNPPQRVIISDDTILVDIADTEEERGQGLSG